MKPKKSKIIIIVLIIAVVLLLILTGVAYTYFATDIFKSNKQAFIEYISDIGDERVGAYFEKTSNTPYENSGKFYAKINADNFDEEKLEKVNDFNISFSGKVDSQNSNVEQKISINYADDVNFPINYKNTNNIFGIQTKYVGSKYLGVEADNLINGLQKLGLISSNTDDTSNSNFSEEDLEHIYQTYLPIISEKVTDDNFSKVKENDLTGYKLTITSTLAKDVILAVLENLKNDTMTLEKLNIEVQNINSIINNIETNSTTSEETIEITVFKENRKFKKLNIKINSSESPVELNIEKLQNDSNVQYVVSIQLNQEESVKIQFTANYNGLDAVQTVQENYELGINISEYSYVYKYENQVSFKDSVDIEKLSEDNTVILNKQKQDYVENLFNSIGKRLEEVNNKQMEEINFGENDNPMLYLVPGIGQMISSQALTNQNQVDELAVSTFNQRFAMYESTNTRGATVKGLLSTIQANNENEDTQYKIEEINFDGQEYEATEQNITLLKSEINVEDNYKVEFEKDENTGLIYRAVINKK